MDSMTFPAIPTRPQRVTSGVRSRLFAPPSHEHGVKPVAATFRNILLVVLLILVFAVVQMLMLGQVCGSGMKMAVSLEHEGLPTLGALASLQEHLAIYRLHSYECLFASEGESAAKARAVETVAAQMRVELVTLRQLLPAGEGRRLALNLDEAISDLDAEFRKVRDLVDGDFPAAMKAMDQNIPPRTERVSAAASALRAYGYRFSGGQAQATFGSFGWIRNNAIMFGSANILVALGAVIFVRVAARRSRAQLSETLARLAERTRELAGSLSLVHATLEATADGIVHIDADGHIGGYNRQFIGMWGLGDGSKITTDKTRLDAAVGPLLTDARQLAARIEELTAHPDKETFEVLELADGRTFECCTKPHRVEERVCGRVWSFRDITARKRAEKELEEIHKQLLETSRQAGMAEVATGVLHNVGNALNSVNVSAIVLAEKIRTSKAASLGRVVALLESRAADLSIFLSSEAQGKALPGYLRQLHERLADERSALLEELDSLRENIEHIKEIVAMQQDYARVSGVSEMLAVTDLLEDSLRMNGAALLRHEVDVVREYQDVPPIAVEKHKVLQVLVNLIRNAKYACDESGRVDKRMTVRVANGDGRIKISIADNGVGIPAENLTRIFHHGFTTRKDGHGFGLHSGAITARELGGSLSAYSAGPGCGAIFTLELPAPAAHHSASL